MASTSTHKRYWLLGLLFLIFCGIGYWMWGRPADPEAELNQLNDFFSHDDLIWWGQYLPVPLTGMDAYSIREPQVINKRLASREQHYQEQLREFQTLSAQEKNPLIKAKLETMSWYMDLQLRGKPFLYHSFPLNPFSGNQIAFPLEIELRHPIRTGDAALEFVNRVPGYAQQLLQITQWTTQQADKGLLPPIPILDRSIRQLENYVAVEATQHPLYFAFARILTELPSTEINEYTATDLLIQMAGMLDNHLYPVYRQLAAHLIDLKAQAKVEGGAASLPDGKSYYQYCLEYYVGQEADPALIRTFAQREVKALRQILDQLSEELDLRTPSQVDSLTADQIDARKQVFKQTTREMRRKTKGIFSIVPAYGPVISSMPSLLTEAGWMVRFQPASTLSAEKSSLFLNLETNHGYTEGNMIPLAYTYGIPGKYLASNYLSPTDIRHRIRIPSWENGWALYAASLPVTDLRMLEDRPQVYAGYLQLRLRHAALALVDVQLNTLQWTRQEAIDYLVAQVYVPKDVAEMEVDKCLALPGFACSFLLGEMKFQEIRSDIMEGMENELSLKDFHDWILELGPMPFDLLDNYAQDFIQKKLAG
ncbi:MAG: DUF885 domain-containing protein [Bacteroidota bacterium]